ncbi:uncharacterized protein [Arachis hypogaea]|uniref:KIB1-4 beta-propeller domain-containing protein n=1 Tax=Arachis hypogaea TaxID=3818 RepID=A0A444XBV5_ARAHY|nr:hypothetical protein Ahy_B09g094661 [Arachis hypogaea]
MAEIDRWSNLNSDLLYQITEHLYSYNDYIRLRLRLITVVISEKAIRMLNSFAKSHVDLPQISTFSDVVRYHHDWWHRDEYVLVELSDSWIYTIDAISFHKYEIWKIVISSPPDNDDFMAVVIYGECGNLDVYKLNDKRLTHILMEEISSFFQDVIFFQDKIYAVDFDTNLYEFDKKVIMDELWKKSRPQLVPPLSSVGGICEAPPPAKLAMYYNCSMNKYVIGCVDGSLLMIVKYDSWVMEMSHICNKFDVFKLNKNSKEWSRIHSLEDFAVMIGYNLSVQMFLGNFSYCKGNHIYYTDTKWSCTLMANPACKIWASLT